MAAPLSSRKAHVCSQVLLQLHSLLYKAKCSSLAVRPGLPLPFPSAVCIFSLKGWFIAPGCTNLPSN